MSIESESQRGVPSYAAGAIFTKARWIFWKKQALKLVMALTASILRGANVFGIRLGCKSRHAWSIAGRGGNRR